jgi:hypothetical protein
VLFAMSVAGCAPLVMVTEAGILHVTGLVAPVGTVVTAQLRVTAPVNPLVGVAVMMEVLPEVAAWSMVMLPLFPRVKLGTLLVVPATAAVIPNVCMYWPVVSAPVMRTL